MSVESADPAAMAPREFSRLVQRTPVEELRRWMHGDQRQRILDELLHQMPGVLRPDRARGVDAVIHWRIGDRPDGGVDVYEVVIADSVATLSERPSGEPTLTLALGAVDFLNLVTGNAHPVVLVMKGRLKTKGDLTLTAKFPTLFDIPKP